jgi:hypothetical protein
VPRSRSRIEAGRMPPRCAHPREAVCQPVSPSVEGERTSSRGGFEEVPPSTTGKKRFCASISFTFSNGDRSLRFAVEGLFRSSRVGKTNVR